MKRWRYYGPLLGLMAAALAGCNDPYSTRRINMRMSNINATVHDIGGREASGVRRLNEAKGTIEKWWKEDCDRFMERMPTVGDYFF